ncbi:hypothetical protein Droror1_Dr00024620, partial [Drosera rotundifolia]
MLRSTPPATTLFGHLSLSLSSISDSSLSSSSTLSLTLSFFLSTTTTTSSSPSSSSLIDRFASRRCSLLPSPRLPRQIPIPIHPSLNLIGGSFLCEELLTQSQSTHRSSPFPGQISLLLYPIHSQSRSSPNTHHHFPIIIAHPRYFNNSIDSSRHPHFYFLPFGKSTNGGKKPVVVGRIIEVVKRFNDEFKDEFRGEIVRLMWARLWRKSVGLRTGDAASLLSFREGAK